MTIRPKILIVVLNAGVAVEDQTYWPQKYFFNGIPHPCRKCLHSALEVNSVLFVFQKIILTAGMFFASTFFWRGDLLYVRWPIVLALCSILIGWHLAQKLHWSVFPVFVLTCLQAIWLYAWPENQYENMAYFDILAISKMSAYRHICYLSMIIAAAYCTKKMLKDFHFALAVLCFLNSVYVIYQTFTGMEPFYRGGFHGNASMNSCVIAFTYPFLVFRKKLRWDTRESTLWNLMFIIAPVLAVLLPEQSMPIGTLMVAFGSYAVSRFGFRYFNLYASISAIIILSLYAWLGRDLFYNNGRYPIWSLTMSWWWENVNQLFGIGPGLSSIFIPHLQKAADVSFGAFWIFHHNDWLQVLFEQGWLGLTSYILVVFYCLKLSVRTPYLFSAACAYAFCALGNFPTHVALPSFIGALLVTMCLRNKEAENGKQLGTT